ncbi:hypothetical protein Acr_07g0006360 [Actinidia rufa]|uniref:Retrotransposon gag domain-containing protein n=1 Tax=Actinidia rufa TaxID=165716 RepID=A0A7J0EWV3_9ERIC|nr:hypothetical protein Acr_07g0006360 [Actinidia rufa]
MKSKFIGVFNSTSHRSKCISEPPLLILTILPSGVLSFIPVAVGEAGPKLKGCSSPNPLDRGKTSPWNLAKSSPLSSPEPPSEYSYELAQSQSAVSSSPLGEFGAVCGNDSSLCTCAAATYPDQVLAAPWIIEHLSWPTLAKFQIWKLLAAANPQPPAAPSIPDIERSRHSNRSGDRSHNVSTERARDRHRAPSPSLRERSSSSESSQTRSRIRRGEALTEGATPGHEINRQIHHSRKRVLRTRISSKFKLPTQLGIYEGKTDPMDHLDSYKSLMSLQGCSDEVMCKAFSATLKGPARSWFRKLSPGTVDSFGELSRLFVANFMSCRNRQKNASHLFTVHQKETESLKDFVKRFNQAVLDVEDPSDKVIIMAMMEGLRPGPLFDSLSKNVPETLSALQSKSRQVYRRRGVGRGQTQTTRKKRIIKEKNLIRGELITGRKRDTRDPTEIQNDPITGVLVPRLADLSSIYRHSTPPLPKYSQRLSTKNLSNGPERLRLTPRGGTGTNIVNSTGTTDTIPRIVFS